MAYATGLSYPNDMFVVSGSSGFFQANTLGTRFTLTPSADQYVGICLNCRGNATPIVEIVTGPSNIVRITGQYGQVFGELTPIGDTALANYYIFPKGEAMSINTTALGGGVQVQYQWQLFEAIEPS